MTAELKYLVLYTPDCDKLKSFYESLGFRFVEEQHGGPRHYSCTLKNLVLEIYPLGDSKKTMLGISVQNLDEIVQNLPSSVIKPIKQTQEGRYAVLVDPDGGKVRLHEEKGEAG